MPKDKPDLEYRHNLILSEDEYHNLYLNDLHWSNHVQYDRFGFSTCLFIGFSMTDPSVRRLMDAAAIGGSNAGHFCILRRSERGKLAKRDIEFYDVMAATVLRSVGVTTLFIENYSDIVTVVRDIIS
jgi:hypothetical protein